MFDVFGPGRRLESKTAAAIDACGATCAWFAAAGAEEDFIGIEGVELMVRFLTRSSVALRRCSLARPFVSQQLVVDHTAHSQCGRQFSRLTEGA